MDRAASKTSEFWPQLSGLARDCRNGQPRAIGDRLDSDDHARLIEAALAGACEKRSAAEHGTSLRSVCRLVPVRWQDTRRGDCSSAVIASNTGRRQGRSPFDVEAEIALLDISVNEYARLLVPVDSGYGKFQDFPAAVIGHKTPKCGKLTETQRERNRLLGAECDLAEKANADLKVKHRCLHEVSLNPWRIGTIARACLAFFHIERPADSFNAPHESPEKAHCHMPDGCRCQCSDRLAGKIGKVLLEYGLED